MHKKIVLSLLFTVYAIYHFATLQISPLPWFDETYFASLTHTYLETGIMQTKIAMILNDGREVVEYGPCYFWLTALAFKIFGFGILQFRIIGLLFGFFLIYIFYRFLKLTGTNMIFLFLLLFAFDPILHSSMHGGRMDTMAASLSLFSVVLFLENRVKGNSILYFISGCSGALAILTTPRSGFLLIPVALMLFVSWVKTKNLKSFSNGLVWSAPILILYLFWFFHAFGNLEI